MFAPAIERLATDAVFLGDLQHRLLANLSENRDHGLFDDRVFFMTDKQSLSSRTSGEPRGE
jgi:hypothetical protein